MLATVDRRPLDGGRRRRRTASKAGREAWERVRPARRAPRRPTERGHQALPARGATRSTRCSRTTRASAADAAGGLRGRAAMTQVTLDVTLVRMCEAFEAERGRTESELARRQEELAFMATHDQLTGLPNRTLILDRGRGMLGRARRHQTPVAALLINLDNFTGINDTLGHSAGDELLRAIAARLARRRPRHRRARAPRRRRVRADRRGRLAVRGRRGDRRAPARSARAAVPARRARAHRAHDHRQHRHRRRRARVGRGTPARRRHRPAPGQGRGQEPLRGVRGRDAGPGADAACELEIDLRGALAHDEFFLVYQPTFDLQRDGAHRRREPRCAGAARSAASWPPTTSSRCSRRPG